MHTHQTACSLGPSAVVSLQVCMTEACPDVLCRPARQHSGVKGTGSGLFLRSSADRVRDITGSQWKLMRHITGNQLGIVRGRSSVFAAGKYDRQIFMDPYQTQRATVRYAAPL